MQQIRAIIQLLEKETSLRGISAQLRLSRPTVTLYANRLRRSTLSFEVLRQLSDSDLAAIVYTSTPPHPGNSDPKRQDFLDRVPYFLSELKRTGVTRLLLWEEYRMASGDAYGYTQFCLLLKEAHRQTKASMHIDHAAAAMVMVDFAGDKMSYTDAATGEVISCPVLVCVLPFSKYTYVVALPDATIPRVIYALNRCMQYFGGVPLSLKTDNMKQVVTKSCRYEPVFSQSIQQWALHYNITLLATRVAKPKDKGAVENEVKIAYQRIYAPLRDQVFLSLKDLNTAIANQLALHNEKLFQLKDHSRLQLFQQQEAPLLQPLPPSDFIIKHQAMAKVQKNYHITLGEDWHHYSVPYQFIGKQVSVVYDSDHVEVYFKHQRIALHARSFKKHGITTTGNHMPDGHRRYTEQQGWTPEYFLEQAGNIGPTVALYIQQLLKSRAYTEQTYNACRGIIRLHRQYGTVRLQAACARALKGCVFNYSTINNILINRLDQLEPPEQGALFRVPEHHNLRGPDAYQ